MSFVIAGSSIGGLLVPAIVWGVENHGWRDTVFVIGLVTLAAGPVLAKVLARKVPRKEALDRLVRSATRRRRHAAAMAVGHDFTPKEALRTRAFWALSMTHTLTNLSVGALSAHLFLHLTDEGGVGLTEAVAGTVLAVQTAAAFGFQLLGGYVGDKVEKRLLVPVLTSLQAAALVVLALAGTYWMAIVFALVWGFGFGGRTPVLHAMRGDYFGRKHFGTILGLSALPMAVGMMVTPVLVGWVYDLQGTYKWSLFAMAGASGVAGITALLAKRPEPPAGSLLSAGVRRSRAAAGAE